MSRRRMMMGRQVVNLFDKDSEDITYGYRLSGTGSNYPSPSFFISPFIVVKPGETYILIRKIYNNQSIYNKWAFYDINKMFISYADSIVEMNTITIPENCYYVRFNGLIKDIDNVKFYKV